MLWFRTYTHKHTHTTWHTQAHTYNMTHTITWRERMVCVNCTWHVRFSREIRHRVQNKSVHPCLDLSLTRITRSLDEDQSLISKIELSKFSSSYQRAHYSCSMTSLMNWDILRWLKLRNICWRFTGNSEEFASEFIVNLQQQIFPRYYILSNVCSGYISPIKCVMLCCQYLFIQF